MQISNKKGVSIIEYGMLFIVVIGAFLVMKPYILHGTNGSWMKAGQGFAYGRQYDRQKTIECAFDQTTNQWYDYNCYEYYNVYRQCHNDPVCQENIKTGTCMVGSGSSCNNLNNGGTP